MAGSGINWACLYSVYLPLFFFFFYPTDFLEIPKLVWNLENHKSAGLDGLTAQILKVVLAVIGDRLTQIFNESLSSGVFPKTLKAAKVI